MQRRVDRVEHARGHVRGGVDRVDAVEQDGEFVARQARHHVRVAHTRQQATRHFLEYLVAGQVAQAVVDDLEAIHVQVQQCAAPARRRLQGIQRLIQARAQVAAVGQAGELVVHHLVLQFALDFLAPRDLLA